MGPSVGVLPVGDSGNVRRVGTQDEQNAPVPDSKPPFVGALQLLEVSATRLTELSDGDEKPC